MNIGDRIVTELLRRVDPLQLDLVGVREFLVRTAREQARATEKRRRERARPLRELVERERRIRS
jgi:hypothetical protein